MSDKLTKIDPETGKILSTDNDLRSDNLKSVDKDISTILIKDKISFDDLKTVIWQKTKTTISNDDPVMILWVMMQSALEDQAKLLDEQRDQITRVNSKNSDDFEKNVNRCMAEFREEILSEATKEHALEINHQFNLMQNLDVSIRRNVKITSVYTIINCISCFLAAFMLTAIFFIK